MNRIRVDHAPHPANSHKTHAVFLQISKKKKKFVYESRSSVQLEGAELALYEEVARTPPFLRRILALVGTKGVGRRTLKNRLIQENPDRFGAVIPRKSTTTILL